MAQRDPLLELCARIAASPLTIMVSDAELGMWTDEVVAALKSHKILKRAAPATSAVCGGCERECVMPVHVPPSTTPPSAFIVRDSVTT